VSVWSGAPRVINTDEHAGYPPAIAPPLTSECEISLDTVILKREKGCQIVQATLSRRIRDCSAGEGMTVGCGPTCGSQHFLRKLFVLLGFLAWLTPAHATIDDAIRSALQTTEPYAKQGYTVHEEDEWGGDLGVNERKAIRHTLLRGTDYWFCLGADLDSAGVAIHVYDKTGRLAELDDWRNGSHAAARTLCLATATYFIVVEVTDSSAERTHWAMVYASKPISAAKPLSVHKLKAEKIKE
jgi:hypothetical protein